MTKNTLASKRKLVSPLHIIGIGASAGGMETIHIQNFPLKRLKQVSQQGS